VDTGEKILVGFGPASGGAANALTAEPRIETTKPMAALRGPLTTHLSACVLAFLASTITVLPNPLFSAFEFLAYHRFGKTTLPN
jgi:hypothetical protein